MMVNAAIERHSMLYSHVNLISSSPQSFWFTLVSPTSVPNQSTWSCSQTQWSRYSGWLKYWNNNWCTLSTRHHYESVGIIFHSYWMRWDSPAINQLINTLNCDSTRRSETSDDIHWTPSPLLIKRSTMLALWKRETRRVWTPPFLPGIQRSTTSTMRIYNLWKTHWIRVKWKEVDENFSREKWASLSFTLAKKCRLLNFSRRLLWSQASTEKVLSGRE